MSTDRSWLKNALACLAQEAARSADTHLLRLDLPAFPGIRFYFKDEAAQPGQWGIGATAFGEMLPDHSNMISLDETKKDKWGLPVLVVESQAELRQLNAEHKAENGPSANRRRMTNIGTFRAYALAYLKSHPEVQPNMTCMVRQMQTTAQGVPLEIYCFTRTTAWADYERIQGDIFDYLLAVLPEFGLSLYQQPSGNDMRVGLAGRTAAEPMPRRIEDMSEA